MYWFLGALLYFLIGTCIFIGVSRDSHSGSWILLALAAPSSLLAILTFIQSSFLPKDNEIAAIQTAHW